MFHAHQSRSDALWVFSGPRVTKKALGLLELEAMSTRLKGDRSFRRRHTAPPFLPRRHGQSLEDVKRHVAKSAASSGLDPPVCFVDAPCMEDGHDRK